MKKNILICLTLMFIFLNSTAQDKGYIGICLGPSIPIGDFASKDGDNDAAGFALTGATFDVSFAYKLGKNFGITAILRGQANNIDNEAFATEFAKQLNVIYPGGHWTVDSKNWSIGGLMFGAYGSFPISQKVSFDIRAMIGFLNANSPDLTVTLDGSGGTVWAKQYGESGSAFSGLLGAGFKFDVGKRICLLVNVDYLGATPEFKDVQTTNSLGFTSSDTFSQSVGTINLGFGIAFRL